MKPEKITKKSNGFEQRNPILILFLAILLLPMSSNQNLTCDMLYFNGIFSTFRFSLTHRSLIHGKQCNNFFKNTTYIEGKIMCQKYVNDLMNYDVMNKNVGVGYLVLSPSINLVFLKSANCTFYWILEHDSSNTDVCFPKREKLSVVVSDAYN